STPRTPPPRTSAPRTPPRATRTPPPRGQPRPSVAGADDDTIPRAEAMPTAKMVKTPRSGRKRVQPADTRPSGILEYLPPAIRRMWPVYAGEGAVAVACLLVLIVWLAVRKPGDTGIIGGQGIIQNPESIPPVDYLRLITPAEASRHVNQRCIIELPVK